jgi:predicted DNA-binding protein
MSTKIFVAKQKILCSNSGVSDAQDDKIISFRFPLSLIEELDAIAKETSRSRNKVTVLLLRRGIEVYQNEGILLDTRIRDEQEETASYDSLIEILIEKKEKATSRDKKAFIEEVISLVKARKSDEHSTGFNSK